MFFLLRTYEPPAYVIAGNYALPPFILTTSPTPVATAGK